MWFIVKAQLRVASQHLSNRSQLLAGQRSRQVPKASQNGTTCHKTKREAVYNRYLFRVICEGFHVFPLFYIFALDVVFRCF